MTEPSEIFRWCSDFCCTSRSPVTITAPYGWAGHFGSGSVPRSPSSHASESEWKRLSLRRALILKLFVVVRVRSYKMISEALRVKKYIASLSVRKAHQSDLGYLPIFRWNENTLGDVIKCRLSFIVCSRLDPISNDGTCYSIVTNNYSVFIQTFPEQRFRKTESETISPSGCTTNRRVRASESKHQQISIRVHSFRTSQNVLLRQQTIRSFLVSMCTSTE